MCSESEWIPAPSAMLSDDFRKNLRMIRDAAHVLESEDVVAHEFRAMGRPAALLYVDGMVSSQLMQQFFLEPLLRAAYPDNGDSLREYLSRSVLPLMSQTPTKQMSVLLARVFAGDAALICEGLDGALIADVKGYAKRSISQPQNETVIAGPHEGFTESLRENIVLIRRMLRTPALISREMTVGRKIESRLCLMYLDGIARGENVAEIERRIKGCDVDYVPGMGVLEQLIEDHPFALLPQAVVTERPDRAVSFLSEGQIVILMENAPCAMALPMGLLHLYHTPDDTAMRWQYGTFLRLIRLLGLLIALLLPAVFVSLSVFHPEGMSLSLLTSVVESQARVPLSLFSSTLIMLLIFSLINEAATRVPGAMGASLSIVGGLILGTAVVEADLFSPLVLIVVALSGLGSYTAPAFPLTMSIRISQLFLLIAAGMLGYLGFALALFFLLIRFAGMTSLGSPYFAPVAPRRPANPDAVIRPPVWQQRLRGAFANPWHMNRFSGRARAWDYPKEQP